MIKLEFIWRRPTWLSQQKVQRLMLFRQSVLNAGQIRLTSSSPVGFLKMSLSAFNHFSDAIHLRRHDSSQGRYGALVGELFFLAL